MNTTHPATLTAAQLRTRSPIQLAAVLCGFLFLLLGAAGFLPTVTTHFNTIEMSTGSGAMLLGIFQVSFLFNVVHLLLGLAGLGMSRLTTTARGYLLFAGVICAALWILGLLVDEGSTANFVPLNAADDWLNAALAALLIALAVLLPSTEHDLTHG